MHECCIFLSLTFRESSALALKCLKRWDRGNFSFEGIALAQ